MFNEFITSDGTTFKILNDSIHNIYFNVINGCNYSFCTFVLSLHDY